MSDRLDERFASRPSSSISGSSTDSAKHSMASFLEKMEGVEYAELQADEMHLLSGPRKGDFIGYFIISGVNVRKWILKSSMIHESLFFDEKYMKEGAVTIEYALVSRLHQRFSIVGKTVFVADAGLFLLDARCDGHLRVPIGEDPSDSIEHIEHDSPEVHVLSHHTKIVSLLQDMYTNGNRNLWIHMGDVSTFSVYYNILYRAIEVYPLGNHPETSRVVVNA